MTKYYKVPHVDDPFRKLIWVYPECSEATDSYSDSKPSWVHSDSGDIHSDSCMELTEILDLGAEEVFPEWAKTPEQEPQQVL